MMSHGLGKPSLSSNNTEFSTIKACNCLTFLRKNVISNSFI